jgi:hypothetical protein
MCLLFLILQQTLYISSVYNCQVLGKQHRPSHVLCLGIQSNMMPRYVTKAWQKPSL